MSLDKVKIPPMECPAVLLPTPANMKNMVKQIAAMPAKILAMLEVEAATAAGMSEEVKAEIAALDREALGKAIGVFPDVGRRGPLSQCGRRPGVVDRA